MDATKRQIIEWAARLYAEAYTCVEAGDIAQARRLFKRADRLVAHS